MVVREEEGTEEEARESTHENHFANQFSPQVGASRYKLGSRMLILFEVSVYLWNPHRP